VVHRRLHAPAPPLDFDALREEVGIVEPFGADVEEAARRVAEVGPTGPHVDRTDLPLVTIDPPGSTDLDQALAVVERGDGWRVHYAIADVAAWVEPGGPIDLAARSRTQTYYAPDRRIPLHPPVLSEGAASLLPDGARPAALWTIDVDGAGETTAIALERAMVRSRAQLDYAGVQRAIDDGTAPDAIAPLAALGPVLLDAARRRGAIELGLPEQDIVAADGTGWTVVLRADLPVEHWNAQVSLLTGRAAAWLMLEGGIGLLRTLPAPDPATFPRLRSAARSLGIDWSEGEHPGLVLSRLDTEQPRHAAFADLAAELLRGAAYTALDGETPADPGHAGVGAPYAHVTAPLRRLVDRFGTEVCLALVAGRPVPEWVAQALPTLPEAMADGDRRGRSLERASVDAAEALVLSGRVGEVFPASVIETGERFGTVVLDDPPVRGRCDARDLPLGHEIHVRCTQADVAARTVRFERVS
jgi:exoribonuclease R